MGNINSSGQLACGKIGGQSHKPVMVTSIKKKTPLVVADYNFAIMLSGMFFNLLKRLLIFYF
jgi:hypothetical protein